MKKIKNLPAKKKICFTYGKTILHFAEAEYPTGNSQQNLKINNISKFEMFTFFKVGELTQFTGPLAVHLYKHMLYAVTLYYTKVRNI
jgi:hypothetical protein